MARLNNETGVERPGGLETECRRHPEGCEGREAAASTLESEKDRTDEEPITAWRTLTPIKPVSQEVGESRHDGKHVGFWGEVAWVGRPKSPPSGRRKLQP